MTETVLADKEIEQGLLNVDEICAYLSIGKTTVYKLLNEDKEFPTVRIGRRVYANKKGLPSSFLKFSIWRCLASSFQ